VKPKISLIITVYNQGNYILRMYLCILNQSFTDIEIIFFDDNSNDTSSKIIENLMKNDKRIVYLKNKYNKGQFYSRNKATLFTRSKYILIIDPDDFLLNNILIKSYKIAKKYDLDITQFYHVMGNYSQNHLVVVNQHSKIIYQQEAKNVFFNNPTRYLWDKLIKKSIFIKSIYFMHENYRRERFLIHNDDTACFGLFKMANSYGQIEDVGYFYNTNISNSTTKKNYLPESINGRFNYKLIFLLVSSFVEIS
jgi:glycosyltransferase involved in cell wall biosynthesis